MILNIFLQKQYDINIVPGKYLYHRCHLIGWSIGGIDVDKRNLMTDTRDFNVYVYNVQDGIVIDYAIGESKLAE
jgi:hypothetical protein